MAELKAVQVEQGEAIRQIEARTITRPNYFTIMGYANLNKIQLTPQLAKIKGQRASLLCRQRSMPLDTCSDARYGTVNMYPAPILAEVFNARA